MELTFSCPNCGTIGHVSSLETASQAVCRQCGMVRALHRESLPGTTLQSCPWCLTEDLYIQKDFPQGLGLAIVLIGFAVSTIFWYYEMPIPAYLVLIVSGLLDLAMYYTVPDVTICYRCLCQVRGAGANFEARFKHFDLSIGERYRQERIRAQELRQRGASAS
jgi:hypothetical protein